MSGFKMDDYVDVAERIREFSEKYPDGSLQSEIVIRDGGVLCKAFAYRTAGDDRPGIGHAFEPVPGKTPYTKDSEVMNAETSAWGRAIVALGFQTKKIASAQEIRAREPSAEATSAVVQPSASTVAAAPASTGEQPSPAEQPAATDKQRATIRRLAKTLNLDAGDVDSLDKRAASARIEELLKIEQMEKDAAATEVPVPVGGGEFGDDSIPFARTIS